MKHSGLLALTGCAALAIGVVALAGPLDPPTGPVAPTYKTIFETEPRTAINQTNTPGDADSVYRIATPGSYYLTGNVLGANGKGGIKIAASGVSIDLMGFELLGGVGSGDAIKITSNGQSTSIRNGSIRNWAGNGVAGPMWGSISDVRIVGNLLDGVNSPTGGGVRLTGCTISANVGTGLRLGDYCAVVGCSIFGNSGFGLICGSSCTLTNCVAYVNLVGIYAGGGCTITGCTSYQNTGSGFVASGGSVISQCSAKKNGTDGFNLASGVTIKDCVSTNNSEDGINAASECLILGNLCVDNGEGGDGAGIETLNGRCRIEANVCRGASKGIYARNVGSLIVRNTCAGNTMNWSIDPGNEIGPIIDRTTHTGVLIQGNFANSTLGTTDPNANFSE